MNSQAQFSMNQTRAEEITMREDYGNITLDTGKYLITIMHTISQASNEDFSGKFASFESCQN